MWCMAGGACSTDVLHRPASDMPTGHQRVPGEPGWKSWVGRTDSLRTCLLEHRHLGLLPKPLFGFRRPWSFSSTVGFKVLCPSSCHLSPLPGSSGFYVSGLGSRGWRVHVLESENHPGVNTVVLFLFPQFRRRLTLISCQFMRSALLHSALSHSALLHSALKHSALMHSALLHSALMHLLSCAVSLCAMSLCMLSSTSGYVNCFQV